VEEEAIRNRFKALFPELADLTKEDIQAIREMKTRAGEIDETNRHHWSNHARTMVTGVHSAIEKELGGKLTDRQRTQVERLYAMQAEQDPEFLDRHTKGDKTLLDEFAKEFVEDWFEPARDVGSHNRNRSAFVRYPAARTAGSSRMAKRKST
jgi:hypothetical protein